jgi:glycine cleavage system H lipoate-binding protein
VRIVASNPAVEQRPLLVNEAPYGEGWLFRLQALDWAAERLVLLDVETLAARHQALVSRMEALRDG